MIEPAKPHADSTEPEPRRGGKGLSIALFVVMVVAVGWLDLFFFDRAESLQFGWFVLSGVALVAGYHFLFRRR